MRRTEWRPERFGSSGATWGAATGEAGRFGMTPCRLFRKKQNAEDIKRETPERLRLTLGGFTPPFWLSLGFQLFSFSLALTD
jgi:hypothetical protein